jgi:hypothetical protein
MFHQHITKSWRTKIGAGVSAALMSALGLGASLPADTDASVNLFDLFDFGHHRD